MNIPSGLFFVKLNQIAEAIGEVHYPHNLLVSNGL